MFKCLFTEYIDSCKGHCGNTIGNQLVQLIDKSILELENNKRQQLIVYSYAIVLFQNVFDSIGCTTGITESVKPATSKKRNRKESTFRNKDEKRRKKVPLKRN